MPTRLAGDNWVINREQNCTPGHSSIDQNDSGDNIDDKSELISPLQKLTLPPLNYSLSSGVHSTTGGGGSERSRVGIKVETVGKP